MAHISLRVLFSTLDSGMYLHMKTCRTDGRGSGLNISTGICELIILSVDQDNIDTRIEVKLSIEVPFYRMHEVPSKLLNSESTPFSRPLLCTPGLAPALMSFVVAVEAILSAV